MWQFIFPLVTSPLRSFLGPAKWCYLLIKKNKSLSYFVLFCLESFITIGWREEVWHLAAPLELLICFWYIVLFLFLFFCFVFLFCFVFVLSSVLFPDSPASFLSLVILLLRWPFVLSKKKKVFFRRSCWFVRIYSGICDGSWWRRLKVLQRRCVSTGHFPSLIKARVIKEVGV